MIKSNWQYSPLSFVNFDFGEKLIEKYCGFSTGSQEDIQNIDSKYTYMYI